MKQLINERAKEVKENKDNPQKSSQINSKNLSEYIIHFFEKVETELDKRKEQGAIDFKLLIIERYYQLLPMTKDREIWKKFFKLINKYLKNEVEEIGIKINKYLWYLVNIKYDQISELNVRAFTELLIYINENTKRIEDIWKINLDNDNPDKNLMKNSFEQLGYNSYFLLFSFANYNKYIINHNTQEDYLIEARPQINIILECVKKAINSIKIIEKENLNSNYKSFVLEKYSFLIIQMLYFFYILKSRNINKEETELICHTFQFILKKTTLIFTCQLNMKYFEEILKSSKSNIPNGEINFFIEEIKRKWKDYFSEKNYLQNKYKSDNKYNLVLKNILKYYLYCFNKSMNAEPIILYKEISNYIIDDDLKMFKNLTTKINDFRISIEIKAQIIYVIQNFCEWSSKEKYIITFETLYFFLKQMTSFYHTLFSLSNEYISFPLRDEKQQQKEILQKNMLKINIEENDYNSIKKNNLNSLFLWLLSNKYDKYIYIEDQKQLYDCLKNSFLLIKKLIEELNKMLQYKEYTEQLKLRCYVINKAAVQLSKIFYYFFFIFERTRINHQNHDNSSTELIDKLLEVYITQLPNNDLQLFSVVFKSLMPYIFKLYKLGCKICPNKNCISTKLIHNIFKNIKDQKTRETLFKIYLEYFSLKIYETGNPTELFISEFNSPLNTSITLSESINNITILKSIFFNLLDCANDSEYFKNKIIPMIIDFLYLSKNSEYYGNYIYILRCLFKYLKTAINVAQNSSGNERVEKAQKLKLSSDFNIEINYILYAIIKYLVNIKDKIPFLNDLISEIII